MSSIRIGTIYKLNSMYKNNYTHAIITYDTVSHETIVELISNWNSDYNKKDVYKHDEPLSIASIYTQEETTKDDTDTQTDEQQDCFEMFD